MNAPVRRNKNALDNFRCASDLVVNWNGFQLHAWWVYSPAACRSVGDVDYQSD
jgi:hypothetical protein